MPHLVLVALLAHQEALLLEIADNLLAACEPIHPLVALTGLGAHPAQVVDDLEALQAVPHAELEVVRIVGRGHLEASGAKGAVHVGVPHDRDLPVLKRQDQAATDEMRIALVFGVHRHGRISEERFRPGRGDDEGPAAVAQRIADMVQPALGVLVLHLEIGQGGLAPGAPVDDVASLVDDALLIELHKGFPHC
jgi:hypothetical protein